MFFSTDGSINLVPQPSPSSSMPSPHSLIDDGNINDLVLHHQSPLICPLPASVTYPMMPFKQEIDAPNRAHLFSNPPKNFLSKNRPLKKGKHTKICTAQGLRDRRVRLSIEIARRFFELQDQLGFDQASTTIEWLLTKSRKAIEELSKSDSSSGVNGSFSSISTTCDPKGTHELLVEEKKRNELELVKESRAKARARARERTRVKMSNRRLTDSQLNVLKQPIRASSQHLHDGGKLISYGESPLTVAIHEDDEPRYHSSLANQVAEGNFFEESVVIKRNLKQSDPLMCYHQNFLMLKDATSSSSNVNNVSSSNNVNNVSSSNYYFLN